MKLRNRRFLLFSGLVAFYLYRSNSLSDDVDKTEANVDIKLNADDDTLVNPDEYDDEGCPTVPTSFSGMTGRLGNIMSTYVNFIGLQYKLGYKYYLPLYMNYDPHNDTNAYGLTKPYLQNIFKNVSFPTAHWSNWSSSNYRDQGAGDMILFNNSKTGHKYDHCDKEYFRNGFWKLDHSLRL